MDPYPLLQVPGGGGPSPDPSLPRIEVNTPGGGQAASPRPGFLRRVTFSIQEGQEEDESQFISQNQQQNTPFSPS